MKVSQIGQTEICRQVRIEPEYIQTGDVGHLEMLKKAAIEYVKSYTGLDETQLDEHEDITIAVLVLISDMYDNRQMTVDRNNVNRVVDTILGMHCVNLL